MLYENFDGFSLSRHGTHLSARVPCSALNPFFGRGSVALVCDFEFGPINDDF